MPVIASQGYETTVFPFRLYDISKDEFVTSRRLATIDAIHRLNAIQAGPSFQIPNADVDSDGFTVIGYNGYEKRAPEA